MKAVLLLLVCWLVACSNNDFETAAAAGAAGHSAAPAVAGTGGRSSASSATGGAAQHTGGTASNTGGTTSTPAPSIVRVLSYGSAGPATNPSIATTVQLVNISGVDIELASLRLRYWLTAEAASGVTIVPNIGSGPISQVASIGVVLPVRPGADHYIELGFGSGVLLAGSGVFLTFGADKSDWSPFEQADDYSYPGDLEVGAELVTVGVLRNNVLVAGVVP